MLRLRLIYILSLSAIKVHSSHVCKAVAPLLEDVPGFTETTPSPEGTICLPDPINMITVSGTPDSSSVVFRKISLPWEQCVQECSTDTKCVMAAQSSESLNCVIYNYGDVWRVAGSGERNVSIKVNKQLEKCLNNITDLFSAENTFNSFTDSLYDTYNIVSDSQYITFTYNNKTLGNTGCNDFLRAKPQCAPSTCLTTMVPYFAVPEPGWSTHLTATLTTVSWKECMTVCYANSRCFLAQWQDGNSTCSLYNDGAILFLAKKTESDGSRIAMKIPFTSTSCSSSAADAVSGKLYTSPAGFETTLYRIGSSDTYYGVLFNGSSYCPNAGPYAVKSISGGFMYYHSLPVIDYTRANQMCLSIGDGLMVIPSPTGKLEMQSRTFDPWSYCTTTSYSEFRKSAPGRDNYKKFFMGYRKVPNGGSGQWVWTLNNLVTDPTGNYWKTGHPSLSDASKTCAVNNVSTNLGPNANYLEDTNCERGDGFICHMPTYYTYRLYE